MKTKTTTAEDLRALHAELTAPDYPGGLNEMDLARYLSGGMSPDEIQAVDELMEEHPKFREEIEERRKISDELFSPANLRAYESAIFATFGLPRPVSKSVTDLLGELAGMLKKWIAQEASYARDMIDGLKPEESYAFHVPDERHNDSATVRLLPRPDGGVDIEVVSADAADENARMELVIGSWAQEFQLTRTVPGSETFSKIIELPGADLKKFTADSSIRIRPLPLDR